MGAIRILLPALLAINGLVNADSFSDLSSCGQGCINNMRESTPCVPVTNECLCENADFQAGIRDCANQACAASDATAAIDYASGFCLSVTGTPSTTAAATSTTEAATSTAAPTTTAAVESTSTPATSSAEPTTSATSSDSAESSTTSAAATDASSSDASSTASAATETSGAASATASDTSSDTETSSSSSASASSSSAAAAAKPSSNGLSVAAKAGVAVGAGAAGVALLALVIAMCKSRRNRRPLPRGTMQISEPLPGSGRIDYSVPNQPRMAAGSKLSTAFNMGDLDHARPYEEMSQRVKPKHMV